MEKAISEKDRKEEERHKVGEKKKKTTKAIEREKNREGEREMGLLPLLSL